MQYVCISTQNANDPSARCSSCASSCDLIAFQCTDGVPCTLDAFARAWVMDESSVMSSSNSWSIMQRWLGRRPLCCWCLPGSYTVSGFRDGDMWTVHDWSSERTGWPSGAQVTWIWVVEMCNVTIFKCTLWNSWFAQLLSIHNRNYE